jgi:hypothetical protein
MRVVAARFSGEKQASDALALLQRELHPPDVAVAPLASSDEPAATDSLLAGLFRDEDARAAIELVQRSGGTIVANIDERWTVLNEASGTGSRRLATGPQTRRVFRFD